MAAPGVSGAREITFSSVARALGTQLRVINALVLRETKSRYGDHKIGFLWALIEPTLMVIVFVAFFTAMNSDAISNMPIVLFMITGFMPFTMFRETMGQMQGAIASNRTLLGFPQVTSFDVVIARGVLEVATLSCVYVVLLSIANMLGYTVRIEDPLGVLAVLGLMVMTGCGLGFIFASISPVIPSFKQVGTLLLGRPLFLTSGLFYTADSLPHPVQDWLLWNPLLHMLELQRSYFFYEFESTHASWSYATGWAVCVFALGLLLHQALRKRAIVGL